MTTQKIDSMIPAADKPASGKTVKSDKAAFDNIMNTQQSKAPKENKAADVSATVDKPEKTGRADRFDSENSVRLNTGANGDKVKDSSTYRSPEEQILDAENAAAMTTQMMSLLQLIFGLLEEEIQEIMDQLSIQPQDLMIRMDSFGPGLVNQGIIQELVLGVHGIDDAAAILTNDGLNQELVKVTEEITALLAEFFGVPAEELTGLEPALISDFADTMRSFTQTAEQGQRDPGQPVEDEMQTVEDGEALTVVYEKTETADASGDGQDPGNELPGRQSADMTAKTDEPVIRTDAGAFTENLVKAFEDVGEADPVAAEATMRQIVEQVVRHVRIRIMPETTSMELQLHPASLGRVALTVATTAAGTATASLVVENQIAKEALESQMIQLKETFHEQGLKVDAVEVTVAEFGLKKENRQQDDSAGGRKQNRRFRPDEDAAEEDDTTAGQITGADRRDSSSMVDYTA